MEGTTFGDVPLNLEMKLEVWDSPNSAGIVIDAVRCAKLGLDRGLKGALIGPSSYFKKSPPQQFPDEIAREMVEEFIRDPQSEARLRKSAPEKGKAARRGTRGASPNGVARVTTGSARRATRSRKTRKRSTVKAR
jgi:myo-inositol-1-phosphate synthase